MKWFRDTSLKTRVIGMAGATLLVAFFVLVTVFGLEVRFKYSDRVYDAGDVPNAVYGVVLGASIDPGTMQPSPVLRDRLDTAIDLMKSQKIMGVLVTGDDGKWKSDEITAMVSYLHSQGVPDEVIEVDGGAFRTYMSCEHLAARGFHNVTLITQQFHMARALYLCNESGVTANGVLSDRHWYLKNAFFWVRDFFASPFAYLDVRGIELIKKGPAL